MNGVPERPAGALLGVTDVRYIDVDEVPRSLPLHQEGPLRARPPRVPPLAHPVRRRAPPGLAG
ncbi:hypothetical protein ACFV5G_37115, partial [Streptomyces sp. NPDC059766]|uniref:hypothetical protein n=1 Tax=Streptomyces sp. NPDC059766 TaxID=3346940 RepID=UPI00365436BB